MSWWSINLKHLVLVCDFSWHILYTLQRSKFVHFFKMIVEQNIYFAESTLFFHWHHCLYLSTVEIHRKIQLIALLNLAVLEFSFVFHDKAKRTQQVTPNHTTNQPYNQPTNYRVIQKDCHKQFFFLMDPKISKSAKTQ